MSDCALCVTSRYAYLSSFSPVLSIVILDDETIATLFKYQMKERLFGASGVFLATHSNPNITPERMVRLSGSSSTNVGPVDVRKKPRCQNVMQPQL